MHDGIRKNALRANVKLSHDYDVPLALNELVDDRVKRKKVPPVIPRGAQINYGKHTAHIPSKWRLVITGLLLGAIAPAVQPHVFCIDDMERNTKLSAILAKVPAWARDAGMAVPDARDLRRWEGAEVGERDRRRLLHSKCSL